MMNNIFISPRSNRSKIFIGSLIIVSFLLHLTIISMILINQNDIKNIEMPEIKVIRVYSVPHIYYSPGSCMSKAVFYISTRRIQIL